MRHEEGGLIYRTGSADLAATQFPTFLGQVLHLHSSALSGGLKRRNVTGSKVQAATVRLGSLVFPAKAVERSDWGGGPKGAVAIAGHHPVGILVRANDAKALRFRAVMNESLRCGL